MHLDYHKDPTLRLHYHDTGSHYDNLDRLPRMCAKDEIDVEHAIRPWTRVRVRAAYCHRHSGSHRSDGDCVFEQYFVGPEVSALSEGYDFSKRRKTARSLSGVEGHCQYQTLNLDS